MGKRRLSIDENLRLLGQRSTVEMWLYWRKCINLKHNVNKLKFNSNLLLKNWIEHGNPISYWLPGIYFPQGFLTGTLQVHARKYDLPIDELSFEFHVLTNYRDQEQYNEALKNVEYGKKLEEDTKVTLF